MVLGEKLRKLRNSKNLSHEQLALELDISKTAIINWESNKSNPSAVNLLKICDFYETDIYTLLEDVSNVNFSNAQFKGHSYAGFAQNFTINNNLPPDILKVILDNQSKISVLFEQQNQLLEKILGKK
jgi:transcriptional regulator with XRE-family HTH domain